MYVHHIIVWASYYVVLVSCDVINVWNETSWDEAVEYCKSMHNGTLSTVTEIERSNYTDWKHVWTRSNTLTQWLSFNGCYDLGDKETDMNFDQDFDFDVTKRCSEGCHKAHKRKFIGISGNRRCVCLTKEEVRAAPQIDWEDCHQSENESNYIVYKKFHNHKPFKECTYLNKNHKESVNCTRRLRFFCTDPSKQSPRYPTTPTSVSSSTTEIPRKGHRNSDFQKGLIFAAVILSLLLVTILVVVIVLLRRTKRTERHIMLHKQTLEQEQNTQIQLKNELHSQEREDAEDNIYEFEEIDGEEDRKSMNCRNLAVKCPLPPEETDATTAGGTAGNNVTSPLNIPMCDGTERQGDICLGKGDESETGTTTCNHSNDSPSVVDNKYDTFISPMSSNGVDLDMYDHAKIVNVNRGNRNIVHAHPDSLHVPSELDVRQLSEKDDRDAIYDLAKGVENEYDELGTPIDHDVHADTYDHVSCTSINPPILGQ